jgi:hypothetical protein
VKGEETGEERGGERRGERRGEGRGRRLVLSLHTVYDDVALCMMM